MNLVHWIQRREFRQFFDWMALSNWGLIDKQWLLQIQVASVRGRLKHRIIWPRSIGPVRFRRFQLESGHFGGEKIANAEEQFICVDPTARVESEHHVGRNWR